MTDLSATQAADCRPHRNVMSSTDQHVLPCRLPHLEVWFQRATDVVRKLVYGDVDIGIVGFDMFSEIADQSSEVVVVHDALDFGGCHLGLGIPTTGKFANVNSLDQLRRCCCPCNAS